MAVVDVGETGGFVFVGEETEVVAKFDDDGPFGNALYRGAAEVVAEISELSLQQLPDRVSGLGREVGRARVGSAE